LDSIAIVRDTVCIVGFTLSATGQQVSQTDSWSLKQFYGVRSVLWGLLLVEQGKS